MTSVNKHNRIYDKLLHRIQHIGIALLGQPRKAISITEHYDLSRKDTPSIGEAEDAFMNWNCAILTAFRGSETLSPKENLARNIKRNECLKSDLIAQGLSFRSVNGCYREAGMDAPNVEVCFFVTNLNGTGEQARDFFNKIYQLSEKYEQDSFLFTFPGENRVAFLIATNDDGRKYFRDDIHFAGPLFTHVPDIGDWTDCSDGRISFRLKGMILMGGTGNKKIKIGEGNLFDLEGYQPDGIALLRNANQEDLAEACKNFDGSIPLVQHVFSKESYTPEYIHDVIFETMKKLRDQKCKSIGFHCSVSVNGSAVDGAAAAYDAIKLWAKRYDKKFDRIVIVDIYGDYGKVLDDRI